MNPSSLVIHTPNGPILSQLSERKCHNLNGKPKTSMFSSLRLYGGVVTQRIANPFTPSEIITFFLSQTAEQGVNPRSFCHNLSTGAA